MAKAPKSDDGKKAELKAAVVPSDPKERAHRATFARDKMRGGFNIRIVGPAANRFANKTGIPVTKKDGSEELADTLELLFTGTDEDTGKPYAVYSKAKKEKGADDEIPF